MSITPDRTVTCLIPAFNEGARIGAVLRAVVGHPQVAEVLVIDDGSRDDTAAAVSCVPGVTLIKMPHNRGKTAALVADAKMIGDMARSVGWTTLVQQIVTLRRMRVR